MKKLLFVSSVILAGCVTPTPIVEFDVTKLKYNEILGAGYERYEDKLFRAFCGGNSYADSEFVKNKCLYNTAKFTQSMGFEYFTMITMDGDTSISHGGVISGGVFIPYEIVKHSQDYIFLLLEENEINKYKNFYKVSDYYKSSQEEK